MRFDFAVIALSLLTNAAATAIGDRNAIKYDGVALAEDHELYKRRGGGGGGGRGGGGGGSRGGSSGSSGSRGGSSGSSGSSRPSNTRPNSNVGGTSRGGSGPPPRFPGGRYAGGGTRPYAAGSVGPIAGLAVGGLLAGTALAFWPGWHGASVYPYHYNHPYTFHNDTANKNETLPIICGCEKGLECACADDGNNEHLKEMIGNGSYPGLDKSSIDIGYPNGTKTILINGTLPKGTTADSGAMNQAAHALGFWPVAAVAFAIVFAA